MHHIYTNSFAQDNYEGFQLIFYIYFYFFSVGSIIIKLFFTLEQKNCDTLECVYIKTV